MQLLLENKANPNLQDMGDRSALSYVADHELTSEIQVAELLVKHNGDVNPQCGVHETPLYLAIVNNRESLVEFLINQGANKNIVTQLERHKLGGRIEGMSLPRVYTMFDEYRKNVGGELASQEKFSSNVVGIIDEYVFAEVAEPAKTKKRKKHGKR
jgi:ankyrin repeat protein